MEKVVCDYGYEIKKQEIISKLSKIQEKWKSPFSVNLKYSFIEAFKVEGLRDVTKNGSINSTAMRIRIHDNDTGKFVLDTTFAYLNGVAVLDNITYKIEKQNYNFILEKLNEFLAKFDCIK